MQIETKKIFFVKRFLVPLNTNPISLISDHKDSYLEIISTDKIPQVELVFVKEKGKPRKTQIINIKDFISVKGIKAIGNKLANKPIKDINLLDKLPFNIKLLIFFLKLNELSNIIKSG